MLETTLVTSALQRPFMAAKPRRELTAQPISLTEMSPVDRQLGTGNARVRTQQDQASRGRQPSKREVSYPGHFCKGRGLNVKI